MESVLVLEITTLDLIVLLIFLIHLNQYDL
jgi:hypothetical protein